MCVYLYVCVCVYNIHFCTCVYICMCVLVYVYILCIHLYKSVCINLINRYIYTYGYVDIDIVCVCVSEGTVGNRCRDFVARWPILVAAGVATFRMYLVRICTYVCVHTALAFYGTGVCVCVCTHSALPFHKTLLKSTACIALCSMMHIGAGGGLFNANANALPEAGGNRCERSWNRDSDVKRCRLVKVPQVPPLTALEEEEEEEEEDLFPSHRSLTAIRRYAIATPSHFDPSAPLSNLDNAG